MKLISIIRPYIIILCFIAVYEYSECKGTAGNNADLESQFIIDMPTAGIIPKGYFTSYSVVYPNGGLMSQLIFAPFVNFQFGLSYSGTNIIGAGEVDFQELPGILVKLRILDEKKDLPAFTVGFNSQGRDIYLGNIDRHMTFSPGLYVAISKNFTWSLGNLAIHGGLNYSFEPKQKYRSLNFFIGMEQSLSDDFAITLEGNPNLDEGNNMVMDHNGLLNIGLRYSLVNGLTLEIHARDLLNHYRNRNGFSRSIGLEYIGKI